MKNRLDQLFRNKLQKRDIPFEMKYWEEAEKMLDREQKRFPIQKWLKRLGILLLLFILVGIAWLVIPSNSHEPAEEMIVKKTIIAESGNDIPVLNKNSLLSPNNIENQTNSNKINTFSENTLPVTTANSIKNSISENKSAQPTITENTSPEEVSDQLIVIEEIIKSEPEAKNIETIADFNLLPKRSVSEIECQANAIAAPSIINFSQKGFHVETFAGTTFYPQSGKDVQQLIGWKTGVVGSYAFNSVWSIHAGLSYAYREGHFQYQQEHTQKQYRFGLEEKTYKTIPAALHFLESPLFVNWNMGRHALEGGVIARYLMGVKGTISSSTNSQMADHTFLSGAESQSQKTWLSKEGFQTFQVGGMLGYKYRMNQRFSIGLRMLSYPGSLTNNLYGQTFDLETNSYQEATYHSDTQALLENKKVSLNVRVSYRLF